MATAEWLLSPLPSYLSSGLGQEQRICSGEQLAVSGMSLKSTSETNKKPNYCLPTFLLETPLRYFILCVILGNRGIGHLLCKDELLRASLSLSHAHSVLITTGFPTHFSHEPPEETDGPPGALALAAFLQALEKGVSMVVDQRALSLFEKLVEEAVEQGEQRDGGGQGRELASVELLLHT